MGNHTALLVMDVQQRAIDRYVQDPMYVVRVGRAIEAARLCGSPVLYAAVGFRSDHPEISARGLTFSALAAVGPVPTPSADFAAEPHPETIVATKRRVGAFAGSELEVTLEALGVDSLVLAGVATGGVLLSTLRQAADLGFHITVLSDACLGADPEVHRVLMDKVFPRHADVFTVEQWERQLHSSAPSVI